MRHIHLLTTTDLSSGRSDHLTRMLASIERNARDVQADTITLRLLLQNAGAIEQRPQFVGSTYTIKTMAAEGRLSLSVARNILLKDLADELRDDAIVAFPDDDCWYPDGFWRCLLRRFEHATPPGFWFCRYDPQPAQFDETLTATKAQIRHVLRNASSNTMFISGAIIKTIGTFDEGLGVGTPAISAEDTDYAIRACVATPTTLFHDEALIGHRAKNKTLRARYYPGGLLVTSRYAWNVPGMMREYIRKIMVGAMLVLKRELPLRAWLSALRAR